MELYTSTNGNRRHPLEARVPEPRRRRCSFEKCSHSIALKRVGDRLRTDRETKNRLLLKNQQENIKLMIMICERLAHKTGVCPLKFTRARDLYVVAVREGAGPTIVDGPGRCTRPSGWRWTGSHAAYISWILTTCCPGRGGTCGGAGRGEGILFLSSSTSRP